MRAETTIMGYKVGVIRVNRSRFIGDRCEELLSPLVVWIIKDKDLTLVMDVGSYDPLKAHSHGHTHMLLEYYIPINLLLNSLHIKPDIIVLSHLHWDHASGLTVLAGREYPIYVQRTEVFHATAPTNAQKIMYDFEYSDKYWRNALFVEIDGSVKVSDGIEIIHLPGHTPGSQGVIVSEGNEKILLAGDSFPLFDNWYSPSGPVPNNIHQSLQSYYVTIDNLIKLNPLVVPSHDPRLSILLGRELAINEFIERVRLAVGVTHI